MVVNNGWLVTAEVIGPGVGGDKWRFVVSRDDGQSWDFDHTFEFYNPAAEPVRRPSNSTTTRSAQCSTTSIPTNPAVQACSFSVHRLPCWERQSSRLHAA